MKTKNTICLAATAIMAFAALNVNAETLTPEQALSRALTSGNKIKSMTNRPTVDAQLVYTQNDGGQPSVYLFKDTNDSFLLVSADDATQALLGYGDNLNDNINPTLKWWIGEYGRQVAWARDNAISSIEGQQYTPYNSRAEKVTKAQSANYAPIAPMTTTRWNQNAPFNDDCPEVGGSRAVTGCVATALAQIMKYHNWPAKGTGSNTYTPSSMSSSLTVDFGNTTYQWDDMVNIYDGSATAAQKAAVATLMYSCGVAVNMDYTSSESSATSFAAAQAMVNYFNYDKGIMFYSRDYYTIDDWNSLVYNQLKNYGPVQYSGQSNDGGHSFVCDGYSQDGYFHINWGWGGMSDGYFLLTALNPTSQGIGGSTSGYNFDQDIIGNVKPADGSTSEVVPNMAAQAFTASSTTVSLGDEVEFTGPMYSFSVASISGKMGVKVVSADGNVSYMTGSSFSAMEPQYGINGFYVTLPSDLAEGTYTVSPAVQSSNGTWYDVPVLVGASTTTSMTVSGGTATFTTRSASSVTVSDVDIKTDFYIGSQYEISLNVTNNSDSEYLGGITAVLVNTDEEEVAEGSLYPLDLTAGQSQSITYLSGFTAVSSSEGGSYAETSSLTAGTYYICFIDENGNQLTEMQQITLNAASTPSLSLTDFTIEGGTTVQDKTNMTFTGTLTNSEGYFGNTLTLVIFPYSTTGGSVESVATYTTSPIFLSAGQSTSLSIPADFSNGTDGSTYFAMLYNGSSAAVNNQLVFKLANTSGIDDAAIGLDVVSTEIYNLSGVRVDSDNTVPGIYIVKKVMTDGSVQVDKEILN